MQFVSLMDEIFDTDNELSKEEWHDKFATENKVDLQAKNIDMVYNSLLQRSTK